MVKSDLIDIAAEATNQTRATVRGVLDNIIESIKLELLKGNEVSLSGFCKFTVKTVDEKMGINPKTGEKILIPKHKNVKAKIHKSFANTIKGS